MQFMYSETILLTQIKFKDMLFHSFFTVLRFFYILPI